MEGTKIFEVLMLMCFFAAWPASIMRSYKARSAKGKSIVFLLIVEMGYICGITNKLLNPPVNYVMVMYMINFCVVSIDVFLYFRNAKLDAIRDKELETSQNK